MGVPYTVALALAGAALGAASLFPAVHLTKSLLFSVFLPGLIFEAALHIEWRSLRQNWLVILLLAVPGVIGSIAVITITLTPLIAFLGIAPGFGWREAVVFGALISATDPIAVVSLFREMGAPPRLTLLLDAESLLNDGTAFIFYVISLSLLAGDPVSIGDVTGMFFIIAGGGVLVGAVVGLLAALVIRPIDDAMIEIAVTTIAAYGSFVFAEELHTSGILATVTAGLFCGNLAARSGMSEASRRAAQSFWEYVAFALNSIIFLLVGFELHFQALVQDWLPIVIAYVSVTLARGVVILIGCYLADIGKEAIPRRWVPVLIWGGLRGALPMVLALTLPQESPYRALLLSMTFGVAALSIILQGLTTGALIRRLGLCTKETA